MARRYSPGGQRAPPSPVLEKRILNTKRKSTLGESLPEKPTAEVLDLRSLSLITNRPAFTRSHTLDRKFSLQPVTIGSKKILVLLVDFSENIGMLAKQHYSDMLFSKGIFPTGSFKDYYLEVSYQKLNVNGEIVGGDKGWLRAPKPYSYYTQDNYGFGSYPNNVIKLVEDAVDLASRFIKFSNYDCDGDGVVDNLFIIHAGPGAEETGNVGHIWSHMATMPPKLVDGVKVSSYSMEPENGRIGVFCHEFAHMLGLPDLYDHGMNSAGTGSWDLMASGCWNNCGMTPSHPIAWCKVSLGWVRPMKVDKTQSINIKPCCSYPDIFKLQVDEQQYFLLENRKKKGFDSHLSGEGLLILHVDEGQPNNNDQNHHLVSIEQCDGKYDLNKNANHGDRGDVFPYGASCAFTATTVLSSKTYNEEDSGMAVSNIKRSGDLINADVIIGKVSGIPEGKPVWYYNQSLSSVFANCASQHTWANVPDLGWRIIKEGSPDSVTNLFFLCCEAVARKRKVNVYADGEAIYTLYLL
jgi:immune inhibitor A